jgi:enoyl-[acyl-carrier-protein] reductase (NADH)
MARTDYDFTDETVIVTGEVLHVDGGYHTL